MKHQKIVIDIIQAEKTIRPIVSKTPLQYSLGLSVASSKNLQSNEVNCNVFFKCEHMQQTGSFKLRGATHKLQQLLLSSGEANHEKNMHSVVDDAKGDTLEVVTASTGNHGFAVSYASKLLNVKATVFAPNQIQETKSQNILNCGATLMKKGDNCLVAETSARKYAQSNNITYISPYNDYDIIVGQGTLGHEIASQFLGDQTTPFLPSEKKLDEVYISVGGGGLIAGCAAYLKHVFPECKIYGCQPENSAVMFHSVKQGRILEENEVIEKDTLSDGTAGGIEQNSITFNFCKQEANLIDEWVVVSEDEIAKALKWLLSVEHYMVEGAAAVALASYWKKLKESAANHSKPKNIVIVLCGRNIGIEKIQSLYL